MHSSANQAMDNMRKLNEDAPSDNEDDDKAIESVEYCQVILFFLF